MCNRLWRRTQRRPMIQLRRLAAAAGKRSRRRPFTGSQPPRSKALGLAGPSATLDGYVGFSSPGGIFDYDNRCNGVSAGTYDFYAVVAHEVSKSWAGSCWLADRSAVRRTATNRWTYSTSPHRVFTLTQASRPAIFLSITASRIWTISAQINGDFGIRPPAQATEQLWRCQRFRRGERIHANRYQAYGRARLEYFPPGAGHDATDFDRNHPRRQFRQCSRGSRIWF